MWEYKNINSINMEVSSLCNAACLFCPRFESRGSPNVNPQLTPTYITLENFKKFFPHDFMQQIKLWTLCGDYGDAMTNPDIVGIINYIHDSNSNSVIQINTNGGMRNHNFWDSVGRAMAKNPNSTMTWSIDGLADTNHLYRRNVNWGKLMNNIDAYKVAGGKSVWEFLIFKHNEHQVEEARAKSKQIGFRNFIAKNANGMTTGPLQAMDAEGNVQYLVEPTSNSVKGDENPYMGMAEELDMTTLSPLLETHFKDEPGAVQCFSARDGQEVRISADGEVLPCCHIGAFTKNNWKSAQLAKSQIIHVLKDVQNSLYHRSLRDILEDTPFQWFQDSWAEKKSLVCWSNCGHSEEKLTSFEAIFENN